MSEIDLEKEDIERAWKAGFKHALDWYGTYHDGVQTIGCNETPIKEAKPCGGQMRFDLEKIRAGRR